MNEEVNEVTRQADGTYRTKAVAGLTFSKELGEKYCIATKSDSFSDFDFGDTPAHEIGHQFKLYDLKREDDIPLADLPLKYEVFHNLMDNALSDGHRIVNMELPILTGANQNQVTSARGEADRINRASP